MRSTLFKVALFSCAIITVNVGSAQAFSTKDLALTEDPFRTKTRLEAAEKQAEEAKEEQKENEKPNLDSEQPVVKEPVKHMVAESETLIKIAEKYNLTWNRLFDKNTQISNPDVLNIGDELVIPEPNEQLPARPRPATAPRSEVVKNSGIVKTRTVNMARGSSAGNTYAPGYCTWYAKQRRPDLPNRLGNASSWVARAAAQGYATGSAPRAGAIGQQGNHVVYIESVNSDGTVTVSEMNYRGIGVISSRTAPASSFRYIY